MFSPGMKMFLGVWEYIQEILQKNQKLISLRSVAFLTQMLNPDLFPLEELV